MKKFSALKLLGDFCNFFNNSKSASNSVFFHSEPDSLKNYFAHTYKHFWKLLSQSPSREGLKLTKNIKSNGGFFLILKILFSTLFHLLPLRFRCVGGCRDWTQDCCDFGIGWTTRLDLIHPWKRAQQIKGTLCIEKYIYWNWDVQGISLQRWNGKNQDPNRIRIYIFFFYLSNSDDQLTHSFYGRKQKIIPQKNKHKTHMSTLGWEAFEVVELETAVESLSGECHTTFRFLWFEKFFKELPTVLYLFNCS